MTTALDVLGFARSKVGLIEAPPGSNRQPFGEWYGVNGVAWCAMFVSWCFFQADLPIPATTSKGFAWTPSGAAWFERAGAWGRVPSVGAVVFFQMPGVARINHVGIVEAVPGDGSIVTIEGNTTAPGMPGSDRAGGTVARRKRILADSVRRVVGFGYPAYRPMSESPVIRRRRAVAQYVDVCSRPDGGLWGVTATGAVENVPPGGAFYGSESTRFAAENREAIGIEPWPFLASGQPAPAGQWGYVIIDKTLHTYHHPVGSK
jgi:surface antigen